MDETQAIPRRFHLGLDSNFGILVWPPEDVIERQHCLWLRAIVPTIEPEIWRNSYERREGDPGRRQEVAVLDYFVFSCDFGLRRTIFQSAATILSDGRFLAGAGSGDEFGSVGGGNSGRCQRLRNCAERSRGM